MPDELTVCIAVVEAAAGPVSVTPNFWLECPDAVADGYFAFSVALVSDVSVMTSYQPPSGAEMKSPMTSSLVKRVPVPVTLVSFSVHAVVPVNAVGSGLFSTLTSSPAVRDVDAFVIVLYGLAAVPVPLVSSPFAHEQYTIAIIASDYAKLNSSEPKSSLNVSPLASVTSDP